MADCVNSRRLRLAAVRHDCSFRQRQLYGNMSNTYFRPLADRGVALKSGFGATSLDY